MFTPYDATGNAIGVEVPLYKIDWKVSAIADKNAAGNWNLAVSDWEKTPVAKYFNGVAANFSEFPSWMGTIQDVKPVPPL